MDPEEALPVVVYCVLTRDEYQTLKLSYAHGKSNTSGEIIKDAKIDLLRKRDAVAHFFFDDSLQVWRAHYKAEFKNNYTLVGTINEKESFSATTSFPPELSLYMQSTSKDHVIQGYSYVVQEEIRVNPKLISRFLNEVSCNIWIFPNKERYRFNSSDFVTDHPGVDPSNMSNRVFSSFPLFNNQDTLSSMNSMSNIYPVSQYYMWPSRYYSARTPVYKGYLHIHHPGGFDNGLTLEQRMESPLDSSYCFSICPDLCSVQADPLWNRIAFQHPFLTCHFVSDEYDKYLSDIYQKERDQESFLSLYDPVNIYTNINGGVGIFGAEWVSSKTW